MYNPLESQQDDVLTDDDIISQNQALRRRLVSKSLATGEIPEDLKERYFLLGVLADADRTAIQNKKIGSNEKQGAADRQASLLIAKMVAHYGTSSPFEGKREPGARPTLDSSRIGPITLVEGEMEIGVASENCEDFMARMDKMQDGIPGQSSQDDDNPEA